MALTKPRDVSDKLDIPEATLAQWRHLGKGPAYVKVGRHVRYEERDVDAWIASQRVATA